MGKVWIIVAISLIVAGILVFVVSLVASNFNFFKLINSNYETNTHQIDESFDSFYIDIYTAEITFVPSVDGECKVVCRERPKVKHTAEVKDGVLSVKAVDSRRWYEMIEVSGGKTSVVIYVPEREYKSLKIETHTGDVHVPSNFSFESIEIKATTADVDCFASSSGMLKIEATTGDIELDNVSAGELVLSVSTGDIDAENVNCDGNAGVYVTTGKAELENLKCKEFTSDGGTGDIMLSCVVADENMIITRSTGDVIFENCDSKEISVEVDTGDVKGSLRTPKIFTVETSTGKVRVPESASGGKCKITTSTGDVLIDVKSK